jgi:hypothetical protein
MKKVLLIILILISIQAFAQTDGLTYQAVIIGPDTQELPGVDAENNILPNTRVAIRFTIIDANNSMEYQEVQTTNTDQYGRINLLIGAADHDAFTKINWDGTNKDLKVEIDFTGGVDFVDMSREQLTFLPFAFHRNIQATGTLTVDDKAYLNSELTVQGPTRLNSTLDVNNNNETNLSGILNVEGTTYLKDSLSVLNQKNTFLSGDLTVEGKSEFADIKTEYLIVEKTSNLKGQVTINADDIANGPGNGDQVYTSSYPLIVQGGTQGIVVMVKGNANQTPNNSNNFIQFRDNRNIIWGRIEGETEDEFTNDNDYNDDIQSLEYDIRDAKLDVSFQALDVIIQSYSILGHKTDFRACFGFGSCITSGGTGTTIMAVSAWLVEITKGVLDAYSLDRANENMDNYLNKRKEYAGVTYQSGAGDYAEYLLRENNNEAMDYGDIVGVKGGKISKNTEGAERIMVISRKPIVLGNMPQPNKEQDYEKVAFMGQVPVKVFGIVNIGDYILPSGKNDGIGISISPSNLTTEHIKKIVGIAWSESDNIFGFHMINVAVGLNNNDNNPIIEKLETQVKEQAIVINTLKNQFEMLISRVDALEQGKTGVQYTEDYEGLPKKGEINGRKYEILNTEIGELIYWKLTIEEFDKALEIAEKTLLDDGFDLENNEFWKGLKTDPNFKNNLFNKLEKKLDKQFHYHKELNKTGTH